MSIKVIIIDGHADFRSLLMHHVTTHWPDAIVSAYDPLSAGHLPDEFSGAGNDIVLLGDVRRFASSPKPRPFRLSYISAMTTSYRPSQPVPAPISDEITSGTMLSL
jgi:hypothetical protein